MQKIIRYLVCFIITLSSYCDADEWYSDDWCPDVDCEAPERSVDTYDCNTPEYSFDTYDCIDPCPSCCWPLSLKIKGGAAPTWFSHPPHTRMKPIAFITPAHTFRDIFQVPITGGLEIGCSLSSCLELFVEGNYSYARGRTVNGTLIGIAEPVLATFTTERFTNFRQADVYVGLRTYFTPSFLCNGHLYFGIKGGFVHRDPVRETLEGLDPGLVLNHYYFRSTNTIGVGIQFGYNYWLFECLEAGVVVEGVATGPMRPGFTVLFFEDLPGRIGPTDTGLLFSIPAKLELKFHF